MGPATDPAGRHRAVAADFSARVRGVRDWDAPSPVAEWTARDVVRHLLDWFPAFLATGSAHRLDPVPDVDEDPVAAWERRTQAVQALLDDPEAVAGRFAHPRLPELPLGAAVDRFYTADVFLHTWDLSQASGQDPALDPAFCAELLSGMRPMEQVMRSSGQFGPAVPVPDDAPVQDRLVGFIGRDPSWVPPPA
ncbi:TIGR03086 family metal-binding protein [Ornithinimicrobium sufpigmenti]|uniref:TIGR03086 family metal-binding protein n=1 Tax=Ornithinimicrobium sufpigmenti TaxID=2508882 RepID=UPI0010356705|nr:MULTISPECIES: TIGR03086 family metal-binding protein [unclassified Ornithinimicrobium]